MYNIYQYRDHGKIVLIWQCYQIHNAINICNSAEEEWLKTNTEYGACFITRNGRVIGDREGIFEGSNPNPKEDSLGSVLTGREF